jgi:CubicO group peptidase (beta-lactamase class C family)
MSKLISLVMSVMLVLTGSVAWAQSLPSAKPEQVGLSSERLDRVGQALKGEIAKGKLPGAVALVARKGRVAYFESFGLQDKAGGAPMANDAIFRIYSMTKPLVSVAAIMLMEDGRLVLTDPVSLHLPQLTKLQVSAPRADSTFARVTYQMVPTEREMTIQDLLRHTSGLAYGEITVNAPVKEAYAKAGAYQPSGLPFDARGSTPAEQVTGLSKAPLAHQPGTVWEYSLASDVLGRVVEAASGMRLAQFLQQRLFEPLKMPDSGFSVPAEKMRRLAQPSPDNPVKLIDVSGPAEERFRWSGRRVDRHGLRALQSDAAQRWPAGWRPRAEPTQRQPDDLGPPGEDQHARHAGRAAAGDPRLHIRPRVRGAARPRCGRCARVSRRVHVGRIRRDRLLGGSEGGASRGPHDAGSQSGARLLSKAVQATRVPGDHRLS